MNYGIKAIVKLPLEGYARTKNYGCVIIIQELLMELKVSTTKLLYESLEKY
jgi:hypothetical protein